MQKKLTGGVIEVPLVGGAVSYLLSCCDCSSTKYHCRVQVVLVVKLLRKEVLSNLLGVDVGLVV